MTYSTKGTLLGLFISIKKAVKGFAEISVSRLIPA